MSNKINLKEMFSGLQSQMESQFNTNRKFIPHATSKGDTFEDIWIVWLKTYLPNRYCVDKAIIIDSNGATSDQIDVVIYDQHFTPFVFTQNGFHYIPAESVYAVFEVKPDYKGNVGADNFFTYAGKKIESVRKLKRTSVGIINAGKPCNARALTKIIGGILTNTNTFTHNNNNTIESHLRGLKGLQSIEMGCAVDYGSFYVDYEGSQDLTSLEFQQSIIDYYENRTIRNIKFNPAEISMVSFFLQLTHYLQQVIGTVSSIDLNAYANTVGFNIDKEI